MDTILQAKDLNLWYGQNHALHDITIELPEHEITAFIGPSGCGKSTFLRTLNRRHGSGAAHQCDELRQNAGGTHVCVSQRGSLHEAGLCYRGNTSPDCNWY